MTRLSVAAAAVLLILGIGATPASADPTGPIPSGVGWSAGWAFTSSTNLTVHLDIPGASMVATGVYVGGEVSYSVTVTDKLLFDGECAYFTAQDAYIGNYETCGTATFTIAPDLVAVEFQLCTTPANGALQQNSCNYIGAPFLNQPWLSVAGNSFTWAYNDTPDPYDWQAHVVMNSVDDDYFGVNNYGGPHKILISSYLTALDGMTMCGSASIGTASASRCGKSGTTQLPDVVAAGPFTPDAQVCDWRNGGRNIVKNCIGVSLGAPYGIALF